jgi:hypothetical protein
MKAFQHFSFSLSLLFFIQKTLLFPTAVITFINNIKFNGTFLSTWSRYLGSEDTTFPQCYHFAQVTPLAYDTTEVKTTFPQCYHFVQVTPLAYGTTEVKTLNTVSKVLQMEVA